MLKKNVVEYWGIRNDMPYIFSLSSVVVLPSYREGFPKVLAEAAACGRPIITSDVPGCRAAIVPNKTGLLVPVKDPVLLAKAIEILIIDSKLRKKMGQAGHILAKKNFGIKKVIKEHLKIYHPKPKEITK